jgi:hypothetical protein
MLAGGLDVVIHTPFTITDKVLWRVGGHVWLNGYLAFNPRMAWSCRPKPLVGYGVATLAVGLCHCKEDEDYGLLITFWHFPCNQGKLWIISQGSWKMLFSDHPFDLAAF